MHLETCRMLKMCKPELSRFTQTWVEHVRLVSISWLLNAYCQRGGVQSFGKIRYLLSTKDRRGRGFSRILGKLKLKIDIINTKGFKYSIRDDSGLQRNWLQSPWTHVGRAAIWMWCRAGGPGGGAPGSSYIFDSLKA